MCAAGHAPSPIPRPATAGVYVTAWEPRAPCRAIWYDVLRVVWNRRMPPGMRRALPAGLDGGVYVFLVILTCRLYQGFAVEAFVRL